MEERNKNDENSEGCKREGHDGRRGRSRGSAKNSTSSVSFKPLSGATNCHFAAFVRKIFYFYLMHAFLKANFRLIYSENLLRNIVNFACVSRRRW